MYLVLLYVAIFRQICNFFSCVVFIVWPCIRFGPIGKAHSNPPNPLHPRLHLVFFSLIGLLVSCVCSFKIHREAAHSRAQKGVRHPPPPRTIPPSTRSPPEPLQIGSISPIVLAYRLPCPRDVSTSSRRPSPIPEPAFGTRSPNTRSGAPASPRPDCTTPTPRK